MFIPLHDSNDLKHIKLQWVTWSLMIINALVWGITELAGADSDFTTAAVLGLGFIPSVVNGHCRIAAITGPGAGRTRPM
jgi:membrane associated rhomboid family serine protease